jgi:outer membrane biosynthesis protein TonB
MYFDFEDHRPDTPTIPRPMSGREVVLITVNLHLLVLVGILLGPKLPFIKALEAKRQQAQAEAQRQLEDQRQSPRFVFVEPKVDIKALTPPPRAELSDVDRRASTVERAPNPTNSMPFSRGNSPERMEASAPSAEARTMANGEESAAPVEADPGALTLPDEPAANVVRPAAEPRTSTGVIADAIRNVQKYTQRETFQNLGGGGIQDIAPSIQFDTKGVEFGPWLRRFVAQIRRNWFVPYAAMTMRGHVVVTFFVHKDGRITDLAVAKPSEVESFTHSGRNAIAASNPTIPLPVEYPDDKAFFTVTFYFNENPS